MSITIVFSLSIRVGTVVELSNEELKTKDSKNSPKEQRDDDDIRKCTDGLQQGIDDEL